MKKTTYIMLALTMLLVSIVNADLAPCKGLKGDLNADGIIDNEDYEIIIRLIVGDPDYMYLRECSDLDGDGIASPGDLGILRLIIVGSRDYPEREDIWETCNVKGDMDRDGEITQTDYNMLYDALHTETVTDFDPCGDFNTNWKLDTSDLTRVETILRQQGDDIVIPEPKEDVYNYYSTTNHVDGGGISITTIWQYVLGGDNYVKLYEEYGYILDYFYTIFATKDELEQVNLRLDKIEARQNLIIKSNNLEMDWNMYDEQEQTKLATASRLGECQSWYNYLDNYDYKCCPGLANCERVRFNP